MCGVVARDMMCHGHLQEEENETLEDDRSRR